MKMNKDTQMGQTNNVSMGFLQGGGEMGNLMRRMDWAITPLGDPATWPAALKINAATVLSSQFPMLICWGKEYIQLYNDAFRPILGTSKHPHALGGPASETFAEIWPTIAPMFARVMEGETIGFPGFVVPLHRNGFTEQCHFDFSYGPVRDEQGQVAGILVICVETTDKVRAIEQSRISQETIRNTVRKAPVGMCIVKGEPLMVEEVNDLFLEIIGKEREAFTDTPYWEVNAEAAAFYEPITRQVMDTGTSYQANAHEIILVRKGKPETVFVDFVYEPIKNARGVVDAIMIVAIDITHRILAERHLQHLNHELTVANDKFSLAMASAGMGTWSANMNQPFLLLSPRARIIHGLSPDEDISLESAITLIVAKDRQKVSELIEEALQNNSNFETEYQIQPKDGSAPKWLRATGRAYPGMDGQAYITGTMIDITGQKKAEQEKDDFISVASHELKTPVTALKASLQLLDSIKQDPPPDAVRTLIEQAGKSVGKIIQLINELLNATRIREGQLQLTMTNINIYNLVQTTIAAMAHQTNQRIVATGDADIVIYGDEHRIEQVLQNLINNAMKYAADSPTIEVIIERYEDNMRIWVSDQGPGIPASKLPHLFARYYRADYSGTSYSGLGLGLYISAEIIKRHGGTMGVDSELGKGSRFWFTLPLAAN